MDDGAFGHDEHATCGGCPVCLVLDALEGSRPEVADHLRAAARELGLALRAAVEGMPAAEPAPSSGLERIDLDDDADADADAAG